jgi:cytochrome c2
MRGWRALVLAGLVAVAGALLGACSAPAPTPPGLGDPRQGRVVAIREACGSCHTIPGLQQADGLAGPPLTGFARRTMIAGILGNTPDNLVRWLRSPQAVVPGNAMPDLRLSETEARDVAAYLETLR